MSAVSALKQIVLGPMVAAMEIDLVAVRCMQQGLSMEMAVEQLTSAFKKYGELLDQTAKELEQQVMDQADAREASGGRSS